MKEVLEVFFFGLESVSYQTNTLINALQISVCEIEDTASWMPSVRLCSISGLLLYALSCNMPHR